MLEEEENLKDNLSKKLKETKKSFKMI